MAGASAGLAPATSIGELASRRITAVARVSAALLVTALASVEALPLPSSFAWAAGLLWLPAATLLWYAEEGPPNRVRALSGMALDLGVLTAISALSPDLGPSVLLVLIPLAGAVTYQTGARAGIGFLAIGVLGRWGTALLTDPGDVRVLEEVTTALVGVCVIVLLQRAASVRRHDARLVQDLAETSETIMVRSPEGIVVTDAAGVLVQANPAAERVLADPGARGLVGHGCGDRLALQSEGGPLDCSRTCALAAVCAGDGGTVEVWRQVGGERQALLANATPIIGSDGARSYLHSFRDATLAKQADEAKTMFLATASHELKTPLTIIRGFTQLLQTNITDPNSQIALDAIETRSMELAGIVDRLLLSSRIDAGRVDLPLTTVDLPGVLRAGLATVARRIDIDLPDALPVLADEEALRTAVTLVVDNAVKYSRSGTVALRARATPDGVEVTVQDHGIGMTPDQADRCFDRFWQAESTDVRRFGGTGIGLYIVRALVDGMGGQVAVESALGVGSTFTLTLQPAPVAVHVASRQAPSATVDEFMQQLGLPRGVS